MSPSASTNPASGKRARERKKIPRHLTLLSRRCHTSYDSNWSLNAVIVKKDVMLKETPKGPGGASFGSIGAFGLKTYDAQDGMEVRMGDENWYRFKVPICISTDGAFFHAEIDG